MNDLVLTAAELATVFHALVGPALALDVSGMRDLKVTAVQLEEARQSLLERGVLVCAPLESEDAAGIAGDIAVLLETTLTPDEVWVLRYEGRNSPSRQFFFSFAGDSMVRNHVETSGLFIFAELPTKEDLVANILQDGGVTAVLPMASQPGQVAPLAELLRGATGVSVLLRVIGPADPAPATSAISWLIAEQRIWLVTGEGVDETAQCIDVEQLRVHLAGLAQNTRLSPRPAHWAG